jgi:uncharacterized protein (TIGR02391 family)
MTDRKLLNLSTQAICDLSLESVALVILQDLHEHKQLIRQRWFNDAINYFGKGPHIEVLIEAWAWLQARALIAPDPYSSQEKIIVTRAGRQSACQSCLQAIVAAERLGLDLHPTLAGKIRPIFLMGDYETSSFKAMKEVEVRVRKLSNLPDGVVGVPLMRKAFDVEKGPLTNPLHENGEKQARSDLFAGAIGSFKNPASHRQVSYDDPTEASEVIMIADLLMRILDKIERDTVGT